MPGLPPRCDRCFHPDPDLAYCHATGEHLCEPCLISRAEQYLYDSGWIFDRVASRPAMIELSPGLSPGFEPGKLFPEK